MYQRTKTFVSVEVLGISIENAWGEIVLEFTASVQLSSEKALAPFSKFKVIVKFDFRFLVPDSAARQWIGAKTIDATTPLIGERVVQLQFMSDVEIFCREKSCKQQFVQLLVALCFTSDARAMRWCLPVTLPTKIVHMMPKGRFANFFPSARSQSSMRTGSPWNEPWNDVLS